MVGRILEGAVDVPLPVQALGEGVQGGVVLGGAQHGGDGGAGQPGDFLVGILLVDGHEDVSASFPAFRDIQDRWRATGPVPANAFRDINSTYQFNVERFYDKVKINRELRDLDFQKNLEAKEKFCEAAEKLSENENIVNAIVQPL